MSTQSQSIVSIGTAAAWMQQTVPTIREAAAALGIKPAVSINHVDHYDENDLPKLASWIRERNSR